MTPQRLVAFVRRWFPLLILGVILASVPTFLFTRNQPPVYQVSATLLPAQFRLGGNPDFNTVAMSRLVGLATNFAYSAKSRELLQSVGQQLGLADSLEDLSKRVDATVDTNTAVLTITARAGDASAAAALANAVAHSIEDQSSPPQNDPSLLADLDTVRKRMLEAQADSERLLALPTPHTAQDTLALQSSLTLLADLTNLYNTLSASLNTASGGLVVVDEADPLLAQMIAPRTVYYTLLAAIAAFLIAAAIASILEYLDDRVKDSDTVQEVVELSTLGTIPRMKGDKSQSETHRLVALQFPRSAAAESYRALRTNIEFASVDGSLGTLLVTSAVPREGKTVTAANLAVVFAQAGRRVLLVDADLRKPGVHLVFELPNTNGLTTLLGSDEASLDAIAHPTDQANLRVLTSGPPPPKPAELLGSERMLTVLERLKSDAEFLIFDSSPLLVVTDAAILSSFLDRTVLVIDAERSRRHAVVEGREILAKAGANVLGVVLNRGSKRVDASYHDYYGDSDDSTRIMEKLAKETEKSPTA